MIRRIGAMVLTISLAACSSDRGAPETTVPAPTQAPDLSATTSTLPPAPHDGIETLAGRTFRVDGFARGFEDGAVAICRKLAPSAIGSCGADAILLPPDTIAAVEALGPDVIHEAEAFLRSRIDGTITVQTWATDVT